MTRLPVVLLFAVGSAAWAAGTLQVRILESRGTATVPARVNVMGSDNAFYQPGAAANPLAGYSFNRKGNRSNVGPLRYQGSFFYTTGTFTVTLPPGVARVEVSKGYGYYRSVVEANISSGKTTNVDVVLRPVIDWARSGWRSVDTHLHFSRENPADDDLITALLAAEGVDAGYIMTDRSAKGYGAASSFSDHGVTIASGQEIVNPALGHINVLMADKRIEVAPGQADAASRSADPLATIYDRVVAAHGAMQHDHAGYEEEILADVVLGKSDWVELLQFGSYRPKIGLAGYYLLLNSGFRYPLAGGSDYPVCRTLSDSMTYVAEARDANLRSIVGRLRRGQDFATSGPLLFLSVNGKAPGSDIEFTGTSPQSVEARVLAVSANLPFTDLEIVQDGKPVARWHDAKPVFQKELKTQLKLSSSTWIAARCAGPETTHAHTNPVWIYFNGKAPFQPDAARELLQRIQAFSTPRVPADVTAILQAAQSKLKEMIQHGPPAAQASPAETATFPAILPRPAAGSVAIQGEVVDASGSPVAGAAVAANGMGPPAITDARGHFALKNIALDHWLFLRASKAGRVTTNTSYLNPRAASPPRIMLLQPDDLQNLPQAKSRAIVLVNSIGADGKRLAGLSLTASPEVRATGGQPAFPQVITVNPPGPPQMIAVTRIELQDAFPVESDPHEANFILSVKPLQKDLVIPAFPGQIGYAVIARESNP